MQLNVLRYRLHAGRFYSGNCDSELKPVLLHMDSLGIHDVHAASADILEVLAIILELPMARIKDKLIMFEVCPSCRRIKPTGAASRLS